MIKFFIKAVCFGSSMSDRCRKQGWSLHNNSGEAPLVLPYWNNTGGRNTLTHFYNQTRTLNMHIFDSLCCSLDIYWAVRRRESFRRWKWFSTDCPLLEDKSQKVKDTLGRGPCAWSFTQRTLTAVQDANNAWWQLQLFQNVSLHHTYTHTQARTCTQKHTRAIHSAAVSLHSAPEPQGEYQVRF